MRNAALRHAVRCRAVADDAILTDDATTRETLALRPLPARKFTAEGIGTGADRIMLTSSGTHAIDLISDGRGHA